MGESHTLVDVQLVVTFNTETLSKLHNATAVDGIGKSHYLYAIDNLRWDEDVLNRNVIGTPCMPDNPVSRWRPRTDLEASSCTNTLTDRSTAALARALETSNDENPHLRDIYLWTDLDGDGCDEDDV